MTTPSGGDPIVVVSLNPAVDWTLRITGFAAGRMNRVEESRTDVGGKGVNVACTLADLGEPVIITGFLGTDNAALFESAFQRRAIADRCRRLAGATRLGYKIVNPLDGETTDVNFPGLAPRADDVDALLRDVETLVVPDRWFVMSGSLPPAVGDDIYARLVQRIHQGGGRVALDAAGAALSLALPCAPAIVKPNQLELEALLGRAVPSVDAARDAARDLRAAYGVRWSVVSLGAQGAVFVDEDAAWHAAPPTMTVASTVGAGDALLAGFLHALRRGCPLRQCALEATALGACAVAQVGPGVPAPDVLQAVVARTQVRSM